MKPPESFVPLTAVPAPPTAQEFRVAILNAHDHVAGPASGSSQAPGAAPKTGFLALESAHAIAAGGAPGAEKKVGEPRVSVQREGDRVTHLRIQCSCGQVLDLACVYDEPPAAA